MVKINSYQTFVQYRYLYITTRYSMSSPYQHGPERCIVDLNNQAGEGKNTSAA